MNTAEILSVETKIINSNKEEKDKSNYFTGRGHPCGFSSCPLKLLCRTFQILHIEHQLVAQEIVKVCFLIFITSDFRVTK